MSTANQPPYPPQQPQGYPAQQPQKKTPWGKIVGFGCLGWRCSAS